MKKLYRNKANAMLSGVFSGIGEYADIDPTILRLCYVFFTLFTGCFAGIIIYIVAAIIMPVRGEHIATKEHAPKTHKEETNVHDAEVVDETPASEKDENTK
jgi:phage shock protein C